MIIVTIDNSYSKVTGLSPKQDKELRDLLSYVIGGKSAYFSGYGIRKRSLLSKRGEFPTGLLNQVNKYIQITNTTVVIVDNRRKPFPNKNRFKLKL